jgi:chorismate mutase / prephenate dehydratase
MTDHNQSENSSSNGQLQDLRTSIDSVDDKILELLVERALLSKQVISIKQNALLEVRDPVRERELLAQRIAKGKEKGLSSLLVTRVFHELVADSLRNQHKTLNLSNGAELPKTIAFHGTENGSYCLLAAKSHAERIGADTTKYRGYQTFAEVVKAVASGECEVGMLPVDNTTRGSINEVFDLLLNSQLFVVGEEKISINHCLLGLPGAELAKVKTVLASHLSLLDCRDYIGKLGLIPQFCSEASLCAQQVKLQGDPSVVAIASQEAADSLGLVVLASDICPHKINKVRYLVVSKKAITPDTRVHAKTSLVFATKNTPGSLVAALQAFSEEDINLTKLESHPLPENPWEEMFYVDFLGNQKDAHITRTFDKLSQTTKYLRVMGSYPTVDIENTAVPQDYATEKSNKKIPRASYETPEIAKTTKSKSYKLASRQHKQSDTIIDIRGVKIGGDSFVVMAGPCSVESEEQIMKCAQKAHEDGVKILRGGCFKPRSSPYSFQGLGLKGLDLLKSAGDTYGMPIVTEVMAPEDVDAVAEHADVLQIGARNMQNFDLLKKVGTTRRPILLKRGMSSSVEDLLNAAEYILAQGNLQVILCERGIRTFETATRSTLDISAVPVLRRETHLPIIVDPSHAAGERDLVPPLALASKAVGAHGIIIEFHPEPEKALSDGPQALYFDQFDKLMRELE